MIRAWPSPGGQVSGMVMTARRPGGWCGATIPTTSQRAAQRRFRLLTDLVETSTGSSIVEYSPAVIRLSILVSRRRPPGAARRTMPQTAGPGGHAGWRPVPPPGRDDGERRPPGGHRENEAWPSPGRQVSGMVDDSARWPADGGQRQGCHPDDLPKGYQTDPGGPP